MGFSRLERRKQKERPPGLMLTSMMDMFTIILLFLIVNFSDNPARGISLKDVDLPRSTSEAQSAKAIRIVLSKKELLLNDEWVASVKGLETTGITDDDPEGSALFKRLKSYRAETEAKDANQAEAPHILFLCDKTHSFRTINRVIKTAGLAGYPNFQFAVLEEK
ncbi:MAG: biopolymer transporter ExbD [Desulfatitalea sp.]